MINLLAILFFGVTSQPVNCETEEFVSASAIASAALQESAQEKGISEENAGALIFLWREEACEVLDEAVDLYEETEQALRKECMRVLSFPKTTEQRYIAEARELYFSDAQPTVVSIVWAEKDGHVAIVSDGVSRLKLQWPGFGRVGAAKVTCSLEGLGAK